MTKPALNAFTAPATVRFARHEHAQITRYTARATKSIRITPPAGSLAERGARSALLESKQNVLHRFERALNKR